MSISKKLSCGVLVINKYRELLVLHVSTQTFWDIPKGTQEDGETPIETALRELKEESSIEAFAGDLIDIGFYNYNKYKDLWLFVMPVEDIDIKSLSCDSTFLSRDTEVPEVDDFQMVSFDCVSNQMCKSMSYLFNNELVSQLERICASKFN
jgi:8-oxo-dGTP pyrophosphatase MutT (NUDIX family)